MEIPTIENGMGYGAEQLTAEAVEELLSPGVDNRKVERAPKYVSPLEKLWSVRDTASKLVCGVASSPLEYRTQTSDDYEPPQTMAAGASVEAEIEVLVSNVFQPGDTVLANYVKGYDPSGMNKSDSNLMLLVTGVDSGIITVKALNGKKIGSVNGCVPDIPAGTDLFRLAPALSDTNDAPLRFSLPREGNENYCQRFAVSVDVDDDALREMEQRGIDWSKADMVASAKSDLLRSRDLSFLLGVKGSVKVDGETVQTCDGILAAEIESISFDDGIVELSKDVFLRSGTKAKKGTLLLNTEAFDYVMGNDDGSVKVEGMKLKSPYGTLNIVHWPLLDGALSGGLVILDGALTKWEYEAPHEEWSADGTCFKQSECSCVTVDPKGVFKCLNP